MKNKSRLKNTQETLKNTKTYTNNKKNKETL